MRMIASKSAQMVRLIDELLLYSRLDLNRLPFHLEPVNLRACLTDWVQALRLEPGMSDVRLNVAGTAGGPLTVMADREKLHRVLMNMIDNFAACYTAMHTLAKTSVRASTIGTIVTGVLLSVWTHWGLFRYYWIIAKEVLTLVAILLGPVAMYVWTLPAVSLAWAQGLEAMGNPAFIVNSEKLWIGIVLQLLSLILLFLLSVFKPWGKRKS